jgi:hypothetical protein
LDKIKIVSWADEEYPSVHTKKLADAQIDLAKKRGEQISSFLKNKNATEVALINMAERPNMAQELLQTEDSHIKEALEIRGIPNTDTSVKVPSKIAHAMVIFYMLEYKKK